jgi:hypothetical protein
MAGQYSEDVKVNPILRGLQTGADVAGTAGLVAGGIKLATKTPNLVKQAAVNSKNKAVDLFSKLNPQQAWGEARKAVATKYPEVSTQPFKEKLLSDLMELYKRRPDSAKAINNVIQSVDNMPDKDIPGLLERSIDWNDAYTAAGKVGKSATAKAYSVATRAAKEFMTKEAPEVSKYTAKFRALYATQKGIKTGLGVLRDAAFVKWLLGG